MENFCAGPSSEKLAEAFEQETSEDSLFSEARADNHREHHSGQGSAVPYQVMVGGADSRGAEQRHDDHLHKKLKRAAENDTDGQTAKPAPGSHVADLTPWRV